VQVQATGVQVPAGLQLPECRQRSAVGDPETELAC
jgi:hypothetical protein